MPVQAEGPSPLLETKLLVPRRRPGTVLRPRLGERLDIGSRGTLTLLSAPPGFGKTTLLADWLAADPADGRATAWLSLDAGDSDPAVFWTYVVAALQAVAPGVGASMAAALQESGPPVEAALTALLNELGAMPGDALLVLDDYHLVDTREVHEGVAFLLEHLPPQLHVVITTRADPALPLARMRARGQLVEIRAADLRFTPDEAVAYLNGAMGLALTAADVAALEARTEGWIAALQLAALSIEGRDDVAGFIADFSGDDRYIVDYLVEEVLHRQDAAVRAFLLETAVLDRLSGPLSDAVTGRNGGRAMLEALDRGNLFLVPLDDQRRWYRYHQLFADVLRARLLDEQPELAPELHRRACEWYEQNGDRSEAIRHALAGGDLERAADLIELAIPALSRNRQEARMRQMLDALPPELYRTRPVLALGWVASRLVSGDLEGVEARLAEAERWVGDGMGAVPGSPGSAGSAGSGLSRMIVVDEEAFRHLPVAIALFRTALARGAGDVEGTIIHARRLLDIVGEDDHLGRGGAAGFLALAYWTRGDLEDAHQAWTDSAASLERAGHRSDVVGSSIALADIRIAQGRLGDAMRHYEQGLRLATGQPGPPLRGAADMHVGMSGLLRERNDLDGALAQLEASRDLGEGAGLAQNPYRWHVEMAGLREATGDLEATLGLLDEAGRLYSGDYFPDVRPIAAMRARAWIRQGRLGHASGWAREHGVTMDDDAAYLREFDHLTLARLTLARVAMDRADGALPEVQRFLERLLRAAEAGERTGSVIEILVLQALAHHARGDLAAALVSLVRAVALAVPEGYVRVFIGEGRPMTTLLEFAAKQRTATGDVRRLLAAAGGRGAGALSTGAHHADVLVEPLSVRELDVLRLLRSDLDGPGIAREMGVSLSTVRTHTKAIYAKLDVNSRRAAVRRGEELDLLARAPSGLLAAPARQ